MSLETWDREIQSLGDYEEEKRLKDKEHLSILKKFYERIKDIIEEDGDYEEILEEIKFEIKNVECEL